MSLQKRKNSGILSMRAKEKIKQLREVKSERSDKLIEAIKNSLKFYELRNKDKTSENLVDLYLLNATLFLEKKDEVKKIKKSKGNRKNRPRLVPKKIRKT